MYPSSDSAHDSAQEKSGLVVSRGLGIHPRDIDGRENFATRSRNMREIAQRHSPCGIKVAQWLPLALAHSTLGYCQFVASRIFGRGEGMSGGNTQVAKTNSRSMGFKLTLVYLRLELDITLFFGRFFKK